MSKMSELDLCIGELRNAAQSLTVADQSLDRSNICAVASSDVGNPDTDFVAVFEGALN